MAINGTAEKDFHDGVVDHRDTPLARTVTNGLPYESQQDDVQLEEFLMKRHGKTDLNPLPSISLEDPLNWPIWKKNCYLFLLAFHAFFALFMFAGLIPGYEAFAEDYGITVPKASYLTSVQILFAGVGPVFWSPLSSRYGRRPILLISTLGSCICNIGGARAFSYGSQIICRILVGLFISPPMAIGTAVVAETFFAHERGTKLGVWTLFLTMSTSVGPFLTGFIYQRQNVYWVFWMFAVVNFCQFLAYFFLNAESLYIRSTDRANPSIVGKKQSLFSFRRINPKPLTFNDFVRPFYAAKYVSIIVPACAYAIVFGYAGVAITIEIPQVLGRKFHLDAQGIGLQFVAIFIGNILGEQTSAWTSDRFVRYMNRSHYEQPANPENGNTSTESTSDPVTTATTTGLTKEDTNHTSLPSDPVIRTQTVGGHTNIDPTPRLYISYLGFLTSVVGLIVWGIESQIVPTGPWSVKPSIGAAIASFGLQLVTTTLVTFAVDCHRHLSAEIGVLVNVVRQTWSFIGPFYYPDMFANLGIGLGGGVMAIIVGVAWMAMVGLQIWERKKFVRRGIVEK